MNTLAQSFAIGIILGLVLFFAFARLGWIDRFLLSMDRWFR